MTTQRPQTLAELRASGWRSRTVKEELRANLIARLATGEPILPGVVGYEESVIPALENAILAGQDIVFLGERGQAKTRMARELVQLLDPWLPVLRGGELNDDPFAPVSPAGRAVLEQSGDAALIDWLRDRRYAEKLATPDITIADLIGEIDPIKVAEGRYLSDDLTIHYGLIPRANRGIVAINELPDLAERIQVGLLNILEERDVQIRGFIVRLPLDLFMVASANPEDYTSRGRIITPLKDRLGSQVRTHYRARSRTRWRSCARRSSASGRGGRPGGGRAAVHGGARGRAHAPRPPLPGDQPALRRQRPRVGRKRRGPRAAALKGSPPRRAARRPRISDLGAVIASTVGKVELESIGDDAPEERIVERLITKALYATFSRLASLDDLEPVVDAFESGFTVEIGERTPSREYVAWMLEVPGLSLAVHDLARSTSPTGPRSRPSWPRRSSSSSRASIWPGASTRTGSRAARSTRAERHDDTPDPAHLGSSGRRRRRTPTGRSPGRLATRAGTARSRSWTSRRTRSSTRSPRT